MQKVLITGFEPFGSELVNPSQQVLAHIKGSIICEYEITTCLLPVVHTLSINKAIGAIKQHNPSIVIALGQAAGRTSITPEKVAINFDDFVIADNNGEQVKGMPIVENAPAAYFSTLPVNQIVENLHKVNLPAQVSYSAGTFVCNHLFYGLMHFLRNDDVRCGFIHIPLSHEQNQLGNRSSMSLNEIIEGVKVAISSSINTVIDTRNSSGKIC